MIRTDKTNSYLRFSENIKDGKIDEQKANEFLQLYERFFCAFNGFETASDIPLKYQQISRKPLYETKNIEFDLILDALV